jgi:hypothetical protein
LMREFGYTFRQLREMTWDQVNFLLAGLAWEAGELRAAQRKARFRRR